MKFLIFFYKKYSGKNIDLFEFWRIMSLHKRKIYMELRNEISSEAYGFQKNLYAEIKKAARNTAFCSNKLLFIFQ
jgi:hypothetical protein